MSSKSIPKILISKGIQIKKEKLDKDLCYSEKLQLLEKNTLSYLNTDNTSLAKLNMNIFRKNSRINVSKKLSRKNGGRNKSIDRYSNIRHNSRPNNYANNNSLISNKSIEVEKEKEIDRSRNKSESEITLPSLCYLPKSQMDKSNTEFYSQRIDSIGNSPQIKSRKYSALLTPKKILPEKNKDNIYIKIPQEINNMNKELNKISEGVNVISYDGVSLKNKLRFKKIPVNTLNKKKTERNNLSDIKGFLKDKFYNDTEEKMVKKLKDTVFNIDKSIKEKFIEMAKIGNFWGSLVNYCNPGFSAKKYIYIRMAENERKLNHYKKIAKEKPIKINHNSIHLPSIKNNLKALRERVYTLNKSVEAKHKIKEEYEKDFYEKHNDSLQYYIY